MKNKLIFILWLLMFSFFSCDFGIKENEETAAIVENLRNEINEN